MNVDFAVGGFVPVAVPAVVVLAAVPAVVDVDAAAVVDVADAVVDVVAAVVDVDVAAESYGNGGRQKIGRASCRERV